MSGIFLWSSYFFSHLFVLAFFLGKQSGSAEIDTGISPAVKDSTKISMTKNGFNGRVETTLTAEKGACFKRNMTDVWKKFGFFKQKV